MASLRGIISNSKDGITLNTIGHVFKKAMAVGSKLKTFPWIIGVEVPLRLLELTLEVTDIATETLNLTDCSESQIQVKKNLCGFVLSRIEITDLKRKYLSTFW